MTEVTHHVYHIQIFPVDHFIPQLVPLCPVGRRKLVRLYMQQIGSLQIQLVRHSGAVIVPVPRPVIVAVRLVEQSHERGTFARDHDSRDELWRLLSTYTQKKNTKVSDE